MDKHLHTDSCHRELKGIVVSHTSPASQDVVWLQPIKPGLFRWMIPTPYRNHTWMPVAVEQPLPKNALLEYFYEKIQENSTSPFKFYSESDTEALLGSYIYDEEGNVSMQGLLDFHCDGNQEGADRIYFNQSVKDYEKGIGTYIRQFYDRIVLSIDFPDGEQSITLNADGFFYNNSNVVNEDSLNDQLESLYRLVCTIIGVDPDAIDPDNPTGQLTDKFVNSIITSVVPTSKDGTDTKFNILKLTPTKATKGDVTITGEIDNAGLTSWTDGYMDGYMDNLLVNESFRNWLTEFVVNVIDDQTPSTPTNVTSLKATASATDGYTLISMYPEAAAKGDVTVSATINSNALTSWINDKISNGAIEIPEEDTGTTVKNETYTTSTVLEDNNVELITGKINGKGIQFTYKEVPADRHETHFILEAEEESEVTMPNDSVYKVIDGNMSHTLTAGQWIEFNYLSDGERVYIRSVIN